MPDRGARRTSAEGWLLGVGDAGVPRGFIATLVAPLLVQPLDVLSRGYQMVCDSDVRVVEKFDTNDRYRELPDDGTGSLHEQVPSPTGREFHRNESTSASCRRPFWPHCPFSPGTSSFIRAFAELATSAGTEM